jgi:hypothetical protein
MGLLEYASKFLGSSVGLTSDPNTAKAQTPNKGTMSNVRAIDSASGTGKVSNSTIRYQVALVEGQPSTTPPAKIDDPAFPLDSYRAGRLETYIDGSGNTVSIPHTREVGEDDEQLAALSITSQNVSEALVEQVKQSNFGGTFRGNIINAYTRFILQSVVEQQTEKFQIVETFTAHYAFFYGKKPSFYRFSGTLLNDPQNKWINDMMFFYDNFFRGTKTAELQAQAVMSYNGRVVSGFITGMSMQEVGESPEGVPFSFDFLVIEHIPVNFSDDIAALIQSKTLELKNKKNKILEQISAMGKSVATDKSAVASGVLNGLRMPDSLQIPEVPVVNPASFIPASIKKFV